MTVYETCNKRYYEAKPAIDEALRDKNLKSLIGIDALLLLRFIDALYVEKLKHKPSKRVAFRSSIIFTGDFVKAHTGMSKYRQRKALDVLKQCGLVDIHYFTSIRCNHYFKSLTYNYQNVVELPNAVRKHIEYLKSPYKFISVLAREEPQPEIDEDDYEYDEYDDLEFAEFQSKYKELIAAGQEHP